MQQDIDMLSGAKKEEKKEDKKDEKKDSKKVL